ncbi:MAG: M28 family peptidase [Bacteroidales bacterium]|nr:M28 family peptidase [Bacteroidales bacterium]
MKRAYIFKILFLIVISSSLYSQKPFSPDITTDDLKSHISYLASDDLKGRYTGAPGSTAASEYIRDQFRDAGLKLLGQEGFQNFEVVVSVKAGENNSFRINDRIDALAGDFTAFPFSKNATVATGVVFAGYGFEIEQDSLSWNDYLGLDVSGQWVMILRGDPEMEKQESRFISFGDDRDKVILARDKGAAGVIFVSGKKFDANDELVSMYFDKTQSTAGIPVIHIKRTLADEILSPDHLSVDFLESLLISDMKPNSKMLSSEVAATTQVLQEKVTARNVIGMLEGSDPVLKNSFIIVGAHYDHLGMGGPGSGSRFLDSLAIHNGADDNASGVGGILELASFLASERTSLKRSVVFVAFDGEELGLLGSRYFVENPLINLKNATAMINFDMIGRLKQEGPAIMIGGTGTSVESEAILDSLNAGSIKLNFSPEGYGPSDHAAFYAENIPVFFFSTGAHEDYHTPGDDWERLNFEGEKDILEIGKQLITALASKGENLTFQEAGPKQQEGGRAGYRFKVTLGIMPDFTSTVEGGLGVGGVKKDGPAFKGGMLKGDVITAIDGKQVNDIYDYMNRLKKLQPGQVISVDVLREDKKVILIIQL